MQMSRRALRMERHHKRHRSRGGLNLVSLMDIFTILVFFLLVNSSEVQTLPNAKDLELPESIADRKSTRLNSSHSQQSRMPSSA